MTRKNPSSCQILLGIDPGTRVSGYGIIKEEIKNISVLDYGVIRLPSTASMAKRCLILCEEIETLLEAHRPQAVVVETQYVHKNVKSAITLGMARGATLIAAAKRAIPCYEYTPAQAKKAVVGNGRASKRQVQGMIKAILNLSASLLPEDAADALALALCHLHTLNFRGYSKCLPI